MGLPGSPVVKTLPSSAGGMGLIPGQGAKIPHASRPENQNIKQKLYCNKFNKDFKNGPHRTNKKILKKKVYTLIKLLENWKKKKVTGTASHPAIPFQKFTLKRESHKCRDVCAKMFISASFIKEKKQKNKKLNLLNVLQQKPG